MLTHLIVIIIFIIIIIIINPSEIFHIHYIQYFLSSCTTIKHTKLSHLSYVHINLVCSLPPIIEVLVSSFVNLHCDIMKACDVYQNFYDNHHDAGIYPQLVY